MRKLYWYFTTYFKKHGFVLATSVIGALVVFSFSISVIVQKLEQKPRRYIGLVGKYSLNNLPLFIQNQLSAGLTKIEEDNTVSPYLAERWTIEDGGKTYRFVIKKEVHWQDGKKLTTADIQYNLPEVEIITTPNDIIFKLPDEFVPFPTTVSKPVFRTVEKKYLLFFKKPMLVGIGQYELNDYQQTGQKLNEITLSGPEEKLIYRFYFTEDEAILAFKRGEVDELPDLSSNYDISNWQNVSATSHANFNRYLGVFFNNSNPLFPKNVRQALSYATSKPQGKNRAYGPINPESWAYLEGGKSYEKDLDRATERLLDEIPFEPLNIELTTTGNFVADADRIKQEWEEFGELAYQSCLDNDSISNKDSCVNTQIEVNVRITNFPDTNNFQILLLGQEIPPDPDQYYLWHSQQSTNFTGYKNTRIDALLEKGRKTAEKNERKAIYQEFQQFLLEDAPVIFLRHLDSYEVKRK
jgi:peptide/nickel transport system substrate-binding protein